MTIRYTASALLVAGLCFGDSLTLRDGRVVEGTFISGDARQIRMAVGSRVDVFPITNVQDLHFGGGGPQQGAYSTPPPPPPSSEEPRVLRPERDRDLRERDGRYSDNRYNTNQNSRYEGGQVPAGSILAVRMIDPVDSERDQAGQTFRASLDEPVMVEGRTLIPRGVDVTIKLVNADQSGKLRGRTELTLDIQSVVINGRTIDVATQEITQASGSRGAQTATRTGGGAALGAIIGAIAGGGKGAAIGAVSGGAIGAGSEVITKGQRVRIPAETRLSFTLQQPINL